MRYLKNGVIMKQMLEMKNKETTKKSIQFSVWIRNKNLIMLQEYDVLIMDLSEWLYIK